LEAGPAGQCPRLLSRDCKERFGNRG
jgi:hypothetical protein